MGDDDKVKKKKKKAKPPKLPGKPPPKDDKGATDKYNEATKFLDCTGDKVVLKAGKLDWIDFGWITPEASFEADKAKPGTINIKVKLPTGDVSLPATVKDGKLDIDTKDLPLGKDKVKEFVDGLNGWFEANGKQLDGPAVKDGELTLTKSAVAAPGKAGEKKEEKGVKGGLFPNVPGREKVGRGPTRALKLVAAGTAVVLAAAVTAIVLVVGGGGDGDSGGSSDRSGSGDGGTGGGAARSSFLIPSVIQLATEVPNKVPVPPTLTTDPNALGVEGGVLKAYLVNGLLLDQTGFLFHEGLDPRAEESWPKRVEGSLNYKVSYLQTRQGALAVQRAREEGLRERGFRSLDLPPVLAKQGISAFEPDASSGMELVNQIWYWTRRNAFLAIAGTGKFPAGSQRPDQEVLFDTLNRQLREEPLAKGAPLIKTEAEAGSAYSDAIAPVNDAAPAFRTQAQGWDATTNNAQAESDAQPLAAAFDGVESEVLTIAVGYEPARPELRAVIAAVEVVKADLSDLARLDTIGVMEWISRYDANITALTTASNTARAALGLGAAQAT